MTPRQRAEVLVASWRSQYGTAEDLSEEAAEGMVERVTEVLATQPAPKDEAPRVLLLPHPATEEMVGDDLGCEECSEADGPPDSVYSCVVCREQVCLQHDTTPCLDQGGAWAWVMRGATQPAPEPRIPSVEEVAAMVVVASRLLVSLPDVVSARVADAIPVAESIVEALQARRSK